MGKPYFNFSVFLFFFVFFFLPDKRVSDTQYPYALCNPNIYYIIIILLGSLRVLIVSKSGRLIYVYAARTFRFNLILRCLGFREQ